MKHTTKVNDIVEDETLAASEEVKKLEVIHRLLETKLKALGDRDRAGLFNLGVSKVEDMTVCPKHRNNLGRYWQSPRTCQYPNILESWRKLKREMWSISKEIVGYLEGEGFPFMEY